MALAFQTADRDSSFDALDHISGESADIELTPEIRHELLDPDAWSEVLGKYARTTGMAAALTDCEGRQSGTCYNPQPTWLMALGKKRGGDPDNGPDHHPGDDPGNVPACSFCLDASPPCQAVVNALSTGHVELVHDRAGLVHLAIPLTLAGRPLGALIAGQVFDQYPDALGLQRLARELHIPVQSFWHAARLQVPVRNTTLQAYGELLLSLGNAFLRQRYADILERRLARTNLRLRLLVDGVKDYALFTVDGTGEVTTWNLGAQRLFGHTDRDVIGQNFSRFFTPEDNESGAPAALLRQASDEGSVDDRRWQVRKDGTRFFAEGTLAALGKGGFSEFGRLTHDVTKAREAEEALLQAQKLETIGVLASGIAHDFNNLLSGILSGVSFAMTGLSPDNPAYQPLTIAGQACEKAADLTHQLLAYAGHGKFLVTQFDLSQMVRDMLKLLVTSIPKWVKLNLSLDAGLPWIEGDASQIQQIVMNVVINGAESIGPEGGSLWVSTGTAETEVWMEVRDSGSGMTDETKARIFDPFFTTKFAGRGLGLAAVSGIVRGHGGQMKVDSVPGKGSTFRIRFPGTVRRVAPTETIAPRVLEPCSGTVLVVDDEPAVRTLAQLILEQSGYTVLVAEDGREAVELFRRNAGAICAVLLDMTMPVMSGGEAFRLIREIRPDVPIVVSTGYSAETTRELFAAGTVVAFVQKPYTAARLVERIRTASQVTA